MLSAVVVPVLVDLLDHHRRDVEANEGWVSGAPTGYANPRTGCGR